MLCGWHLIRFTMISRWKDSDVLYTHRFKSMACMELSKQKKIIRVVVYELMAVLSFFSFSIDHFRDRGHLLLSLRTSIPLLSLLSTTCFASVAAGTGSLVVGS